MILVDSRVGSRELQPIISKMGVKCDQSVMDYGDFCFEGNGPKGRVLIGIERKTVADLLQCIDDARYSAHQLPGMMSMYDRVFLILEGNWKPHNPDGTLMEHWGDAPNGWRELRYRTKRVMYNKLYRYLISLSLAGVMVTYSRDMWGTAFNVCETYHYFQKKWGDHTSLREVQKLNLPCFTNKPSLVRMWAASIADVGVKFSEQAERLFKTPAALAKSEEKDWMRIPNLGAKTAISIIKQINGWKD